ncbi:MAG: hypothetical protein WCO60_05600 [Verrucomicrobiota bacterium]
MTTEDPVFTTPRPVDKMTDTAAKAWETTREKAGEAIETGERYVRDHPGTSALSIFGFGVLLGALVGWSMAKEDDYTTYVRKFAKRWGHKLNLD